MSEDVAMTAVVILLAMIAGWLLAALVMWAISEWDERKWRRRMREIEFEQYDMLNAIQENRQARFDDIIRGAGRE